MDVNAQDLVSAGKSLGAAGVSFVLGGMWLRRKLSRDGVELTKDKAEEGIIKHLEDERDKLKTDKLHLIERITTIENERNEAQLRVSKLSVEVRYLTEKVEELKEMTEKLLTKLENATTELHKFAIINARLEAMDALELSGKHHVFTPPPTEQ
jgi:chromosome segregation ATPase